MNQSEFGFFGNLKSISSSKDSKDNNFGLNSINRLEMKNMNDNMFKDVNILSKLDGSYLPDETFEFNSQNMNSDFNCNFSSKKKI